MNDPTERDRKHKPTHSSTHPVTQLLPCRFGHNIFILRVVAQAMLCYDVAKAIAQDIHPLHVGVQHVQEQVLAQLDLRAAQIRPNILQCICAIWTDTL